MGIRSARPFLLAVILCLLPGCWFSHARLVDPSSSAAVDFEGEWQDPEGGPGSRLSIVPNGDGSYSLGDGEEALTTYYLAMGNRWFVAQYEADPGELEEGREIYMFQPVRAESGILRLYKPLCDDAAAAITGVTSDGQACMIENTEALKALAADFIHRVETGEIEAEEEVFVRPTNTL